MKSFVVSLDAAGELTLNIKQTRTNILKRRGEGEGKTKRIRNNVANPMNKKIKKSRVNANEQVKYQRGEPREKK